MVTRSYVKIYGPPVLKAIKALEKIAIDMPQVCIMDTIIAQPTMSSRDFPSSREALEPSGGYMQYFSLLGDIKEERCSKIVSKSGEMLGEHDFFFEWFKKPTQDE